MAAIIRVASFVEGREWVISSGHAGAEGWTTSTAYATATNTTLTSLWHEIMAARGAGSYQEGACLRCFMGVFIARASKLHPGRLQRRDLP
jgi:hypothetical protein